MEGGRGGTGERMWLKDGGVAGQQVNSWICAEQRRRVPCAGGQLPGYRVLRDLNVIKGRGLTRPAQPGQVEVAYLPWVCSGCPAQLSSGQPERGAGLHLDGARSQASVRRCTQDGRHYLRY